VCGLSHVGGFNNHANWTIVAYNGTAKWDARTSDDGDDNINIENLAAATAQNPGYVHTEYLSDETTKVFTTPFWVDNNTRISNGKASGIDGHEVLQIGVLGLDCAHDCGSEIHPVYAMAVHVKVDPNDDTWAFFARNWGKEGFCSDGSVNAPLLTRVFLKLPWWGKSATTATTVPTVVPTVLPSSVWEGLYWGDDATGTGVRSFPLAGDGFVVEVDLPDPSKQVVVDGEFHLKWTQTGSKSTPSPSAQPPVRVVAQSPTSGSLEPERRVDEALARLPNGLRVQISQVLSERSVPHSTGAHPSTNLSRPPADFRPAGSAQGSSPNALPKSSRIQMAPNSVAGQHRIEMYRKVDKILRDSNVVKVP